MMFRKPLLLAGMLLASIGTARADVTSASGTAILSSPASGAVFHGSPSVTFTSTHSEAVVRTDGFAYSGAVSGTYTFINGFDFTVITSASGRLSWISGDGTPLSAPTGGGTLTISASHTLSVKSYPGFAKTKWRQSSPAPTLPDPILVAYQYNPFTVAP